MRHRTTILLIDSPQSNLSQMVGTLLVAGYEVIYRSEQCGDFQPLTEGGSTIRNIDLLIVESSPTILSEIREIAVENKTDAVLLVDLRSNTPQPYRIENKQGWLYHPSALLAAIKELIHPHEFKPNQDNRTHCDERSADLRLNTFSLQDKRHES